MSSPPVWLPPFNSHDDQTTLPWLPPLNSHDQKEISVEISQTHPGVNLVDSDLQQRLIVRIDARVDFVSESKHPNLRSFCGLSIWDECSCLISESNRLTSFIMRLMLYEVISFGLEGDITWSEKHLDQEEFSSRQLSQDDDLDPGDHQVFDEITKFLHDMVKKEYNIGKNALTFNLIIRKKVTIPDEELASWHSWFDAKIRSDKFFQVEYWRAISRPRTEEELISEIGAYRTKLTNSWMLEELAWEKVVESSSEKCCSI